MPQLRGLMNIYDLDLFAVKQIARSFLRTHTRARAHESVQRGVRYVTRARARASRSMPRNDQFRSVAAGEPGWPFVSLLPVRGRIRDFLEIIIDSIPRRSLEPM